MSRCLGLTLDTLERELSLVASRLARRRGRGLYVVLSLAHDSRCWYKEVMGREEVEVLGIESRSESEKEQDQSGM